MDLDEHAALDRGRERLETGKRADVAVWSGSPLSVYSRAELVIAGGEITYDRGQGATPSDFELANSATQRVP